MKPNFQNNDKNLLCGKNNQELLTWQADNFGNGVFNDVSSESVADKNNKGLSDAKKVFVPKGLRLPNKFLSNCNFSYVGTVITGGEDEQIVFCKEKPQSNFLDLNDAKSVFTHFDIEDIADVYDLEELINYVRYLKKSRLKLPFPFVKDLCNVEILQEFEGAYFKFFKRELAEYLPELLKVSKEEIASFYAFAKVLGCFSKENILDESGEKTEDFVCHKASVLLANLLKVKILKIGCFSKYFKTLNIQRQCGQNFLRFLSAKSGKNEFVNAKILVNNLKEFPDFFEKIMENFDDAKGFKYSLNKHGQPKEFSWETALKKYYLASYYSNVSWVNADMAELYYSKGIDENIFIEANELYEFAEIADVPHHILGEKLKEVDASKKFTYEMLDKYDPKNAILGLFCDCCATIASEYYGKDIAEHSIIADDVQNMVIKDKLGEIVAKGTMFVNAQKGYIVFNDFETKDKYKEKYCGSNEEKNLYRISKLYADRQEIFNALIRGIEAFMERYNQLNPNAPIKNVNVGGGFNKFLEFCEEYPKVKSRLYVPFKYGFLDSSKQQFSLYSKKKTLKKPVVEKQLFME